jgi:uncharacterized membrane protein
LTADPQRGAPADLDHAIARLLTYGTYASVALLAVGVVVMFARRIAPLAGGPAFQPSLVVDDVLHLRAAGFQWLGLVAVIATPTARVIAALIGFVRRGERTMALVAALVLAVIAFSVVLAQTVEA